MVKAVALAWIGKKIFDRVTSDEEPEKRVAAPTARTKKTRARAA
jgi:hypothetical protein